MKRPSEVQSVSGSQLVAVGTNAVRSARNGADLLIRVWEDLGVAVRVLQGEEEAQLSFQGAMAGFAQQCAVRGTVCLEGPVTVLDIGGGSTELVMGDGHGVVHWSGSVDIGAVRLSELYQRGECHRIPTSQPYLWEATEMEELSVLAHTAEHYLRQGFEPQIADHSKGLLIGVGGTCTSLAAMDLGMQEYRPEAIQGYCLTVEQIAQLGMKIARLSLVDRQSIQGLQPQRGDIILAGIALVLALMRVSGHTELVVSDTDILLGLIRQFHSACIRSENRV